MLPIRTILILAIPLIQTVLLFAGVFFENFYLYFAIAAFVLSDALLYFLFPSSLSKKTVTALSAPPIVLYLSTAVAVVFLDNSFAIGMVVAINAIISGIYLHALPSRLERQKEQGQPSPIFIGAFAMLVVALACMLSLLLFALLYFLDIPLWMTIVPYLALYLSIMSIYFYERGLQNNQIIILIGIAAVVLAQIIYSLTWLPLSYLPLTAIVTIASVVLLDALLDYRMKHTLLAAAIMLLLILITSIWR